MDQLSFQSRYVVEHVGIISEIYTIIKIPSSNDSHELE